MASTLLANSWHKYYWAQKHMQAVNPVLQRIIDKKTNAVAVKVDIETEGDRAAAVVRVVGLPVIPVEASLQLGCVMQNFRAALDHLCWELVKIGSDPRPKLPQRIQFPMATSAESFRGQIGERLPGVPHTYRAIVRRYQPYRRGETAKAMRWLCIHSDTDKHRLLIPTVMNQSAMNFRIGSNWTFAGVEQLVRQPTPLNVGTKLIRCTLLRTGTTACAVNVEGDHTVYPAFGRGVGVEYAVNLIADTVLAILTEFDDLL